tara:strand:- start:209 stop:385 length:177 start_codon:yes stop_codon:yes gene_type:complete
MKIRGYSRNYTFIKLPAQEVNIKHVCYAKTSYTHGRMRMRHNVNLNGNGAYRLEKGLK